MFKFNCPRACPLCLTVCCAKQRCSLPSAGLALFALRCAVLNKGADFPPPGSPSPSSLRDATSPKVRGLGSPPSFQFGIFTPCCRKKSRQALRSDFTPLPRAPTLGELDAVRRPERARPLPARLRLSFACTYVRAMASPLPARLHSGLCYCSAIAFSARRPISVRLCSFSKWIFSAAA